MIALSVLVLSQSVFTYSDSKGDLSIRANNGQGEIIQDGWKFDLRGAVVISSKKEKFTLTAPQVIATIGKSKDAKSPNELRTAKAVGGVRVTQSGPGVSSTLQSKSATYKASGQGAVVDAVGSVRIQNIDSRKRETMVATGSSGSATLNPDSKRGVETATLNGPVRVEVVQARDNSKVVFTGNKLVMNKGTVTLTGNVKASGSGASQFGNLSNVDSVVVQLNDKGEMSRFRFKSGGGL